VGNVADGPEQRSEGLVALAAFMVGTLGEELVGLRPVESIDVGPMHTINASSWMSASPRAGVAKIRRAQSSTRLLAADNS